jgi:hypothetical protein
MVSLIFLTAKKDSKVKAHTCANGSTPREYTNYDEATSLTAMTESHLITAAINNKKGKGIDTKQGKYIIIANIPNVFVQTVNGLKANSKKTIMKIKEPLVNMLANIALHEYQDFVGYKGKHKIFYMDMLKALYGMFQSSLLYYKKFRKNLEEIRCLINPCNPCVANMMVNKNQHIITWHVNDLKSNHIDPKVNDNYLLCLIGKYASDNIGEIKAVKEKKHFLLLGVVKVDMTQYGNNEC